MYGPKTMQPKNPSINTNSIRLEPLDVTSINILQSLDRGKSAPASLTNDIASLQSVGIIIFINMIINLILIL